MNRILLVEDDPDISDNLTSFLNGEQFVVDTASGQAEALDRISQGSYDLALLDVSLKDGNGFGVCTAIKSSSQIPVIFLTASSDEFSVVTGLDLGADDYITKPFRPGNSSPESAVCFGGAAASPRFSPARELTVDTKRGLVCKNGQEIVLSALEYRLLLYFFNNRGHILSRNQLLEEIWDVAGEFVNDNTLTVYIKRIREKIEDDPANPKFIKTVRGLGYRMD